MKTNFLLWCALGAAVGGLAIVGTGCRENKANAEVAVFPAAATSAQPAAVEKPAPAAPAVVPALPPVPANPVVAVSPEPPPPPAPIIITNPTPRAPEVAAPSGPAPAASTAQVVQEPVLPEAATVSPALADLVKMMHSGVSEDVLVSYVTNSAESFYVGADQVVYLKDIGASPGLITMLLLHEGQPQIVARRQAIAAVKPLPEGVAVNTPVANVYPGQTRQTQSSEPTPVTNPVEASAGPPPPTGTAPVPVEAPQSAVEVSSFYSSMSPYGTWVDIPDYGYCWRPTVAVYNAGWAPYRDAGRWLWSDAGWYWYSDYSWGWAPFHYGRWCTYPGYGWVRSPGTVWGPAWVTWRYDDAYCGWAPLPPACGYSMGVGLTWGGGAVGVGFGFGLGWNCYSFVGWNNFCSPYPYRYCAQPAVVQNIFNKTVVVNNYYSANSRTVVNKGVGTERIAGPVPKATIREASLNGGKMSNGSARREMLSKDGTLSVYRPEYTGANGSVATRRLTSAAGTSTGKPSPSSASRPAGMERTAAAARNGSTSSSATPAGIVPGTGTSSSRPAAAMPTSRFQSTPRVTASGATPSAPATRTSPTVVPGARSSSPMVTPTPSGSGTVRSVSPTPTAPRSVTTPTAQSSRGNSPSAAPSPSYRAPSAPSSAPRSTAPSVRSTPSYSAPAVRSAPIQSAPAVRSTPSYPAPAARSTPSYSAPAVRSAPSYSAPATRSTPSGGRSGKD
jgi:hypothetical protein